MYDGHYISKNRNLLTEKDDECGQISDLVATFHHHGSSEITFTGNSSLFLREFFRQGLFDYIRKLFNTGTFSLKLGLDHIDDLIEICKKSS